MPQSSLSDSFDYRSRIKHSAEKAEKYQRRRARKHRNEMALLDRGLRHLRQVRSVLDAPCGVGRACLLLEQRGFEVTGVDLGEGALQAAREAVQAAGASALIERADLERLPYNAGQFDACLCFRFIHHLPTAALRQRIIAELCRVAGRYVLISYLSPLSVTSLRRRLGQTWRKRPQVQHCTRLTELRQHFAAAGFDFEADLAQLPLLHSLHLAIFRRRTVLP
ncbi:class I SAM-dependent methyltransferase [Desulfuromonas thiophila]|jgi:2-polyprenyl-3-methyl-5-hydroxy-6-metoxy-1,4-benzoquinol methylase|uniref:Methyltransferase domain-containing protein n=1 Tax=Desulfuromonas thiophila TaxID=57664 RepID=A0A1G6WUF1_9BACT|nr:class I SAM-dependent methyltransferase [Desulfuromonas thiophila]MCB5285980.1 methyltransferase domain-containing protein [Candidatus Cloacimonadota bacterium]MDY0368018.1 methyltransferase domain-containing protein [Candidatus Syntrophosphaera sp.]SDD68655.1 Methyltransferase domain-containing protein [Desulfuromonas thiophila]